MKILLLDADGVLLKKHRYFSEVFAEEHGVSPDEVIPFFKNEFRKCQEGEADLKEELVPYLEKWKWRGSVDDFMQYWFEMDTQIDEEVLGLAQTAREGGVECYLATDQEKYRAAFIKEKFGDTLDGFFFSCEVGASKDTPQFFETVLAQTQVQPSDVTYVDDDEANVAVAKALGIDAHFYDGIDVLKQLL